MGSQKYSRELHRALERPDADKLLKQIDAYALYFAEGEGDWPDIHADDFFEINNAHWDDLDKALAYVMIAASRSDDPNFLGVMACSLLEDVLVSPSNDLLARIAAEVRRSARFRWLLSHPYKIAISDDAWDAIEKFRSTGPHEEPPHDTLPPRD